MRLNVTYLYMDILYVMNIENTLHSMRVCVFVCVWFGRGRESFIDWLIDKKQLQFQIVQKYKKNTISTFANALSLSLLLLSPLL